MSAIFAKPFLKGSIPIILRLGYLFAKNNRFSPFPGPISIMIFLFLLLNKFFFF